MALHFGYNGGSSRQSIYSKLFINVKWRILFFKTMFIEHCSSIIHWSVCAESSLLLVEDADWYEAYGVVNIADHHPGNKSLKHICLCKSFDIFIFFDLIIYLTSGHLHAWGNPLLQMRPLCLQCWSLQGASNPSPGDSKLTEKNSS